MTADKEKSVKQLQSTPEPQILGLVSTNTLDIDQINYSKEAIHCFHCHLPVPSDIQLTSRIDDEEKPVCCQGCKAVADAIVASGHTHFYHVRSEPSPTGSELLPEFLRETQIYDQDSIQKEFVHEISESEREASLILEGITCAACVWLNEQHIASLSGVVEVRVNYATRRAWLRWDSSVIKLSEILRAIQAIGYRAYPYNTDQQQALHRRERQMHIRRLAVAGLFGMQVMMISISLYSGTWAGMDTQFETLFRWLSLALTLPVLFYSSATFFRSAWYDLSNRRVGMDVPVSLGIGVAFISSLMAIIRGEGEIYFDSVVMFTFLLLLSRYFEWMARQQSAESVERLAYALPMTANMLDANGKDSQVAASVLKIDDCVVIRPGEVIPADAVVTSGSSSIDESLLSGESSAVDKFEGDMLIGGSVNIESPLQARIISVGSDTVLSSIHNMVEAAQSDKPPVAQLADRIASKFIIAVICIAVAVSLYWWFAGNQNWLEITLALLIITCPCALSLATPAALSAGLNRMQSLGLLVKKGRTIDALDKVTHVVFDKTGTLTIAKPVVQQIICNHNNKKSECLTIAASMEQQSEHPLAKAILEAARDVSIHSVESLVNRRGCGLTAVVDGQHYVLGSIEFTESFCGCALPASWIRLVEADAATPVVLATSGQIIAVFMIQDEIRSDASALVSELEGLNIKTMLMSGDRKAACKRVADEIGIGKFYAELKPDQKMAKVVELQQEGAHVLMVGDGTNDAPVMSVANVSIAVGGATALAKNSADIVIMGDKLQAVLDVMSLANKIQMIVKQNFFWAIAYNFCAIPLAATGFVSPWMAAVGMSLSSLIVVSNAMRLIRPG